MRRNLDGRVALLAGSVTRCDARGIRTAVLTLERGRAVSPCCWCRGVSLLKLAGREGSAAVTRAEPKAAAVTADEYGLTYALRGAAVRNRVAACLARLAIAVGRTRLTDVASRVTGPEDGRDASKGSHHAKEGHYTSVLGPSLLRAIENPDATPDQDIYLATALVSCRSSRSSTTAGRARVSCGYL
jgi:hypothetical protein